MPAKCSFCEELITAGNQGQFFPEDDSYICTVCQKEHKTVLESIRNHSHRKSTAVRQMSVE
jgi:ribosomal protein L24E